MSETAKRKIGRSQRAVAWLLSLGLVGCAAKNVERDFNRGVDQAVVAQWEKVKPTVRNPEHATLLTRLAAARELYNGGQYEAAYRAFRGIMVNKNFRRYREYDDAKFYMANALYQLGMNYGALTYFIDILRGETEKVYKEESLEKSLMIAQEYRDNELILYLTSVLPSEILSARMKETLRFFVAKDLYNKNEFERAWDIFNSIGEQNKLYLVAQYHVGVLALRAGNYDIAARTFETIVQLNAPEEYYEGENIRELALLARGRIYYEFGKFAEAMSYYNRIRRDSPNYPVALYEVAWTLYKKGDLDKALAVLHSLTSPFFDLTYFPKATLLQGVIYLDLCYYREALKALKEIRDRYENLRYSLKTFYQVTASSENYYPALVDSRTKEFRYAGRGRFRNITKLIAINKDFMTLHRHIQALDHEAAMLDQLHLGDGERFLRQIMAKKKERLLHNVNQVAAKRLKEVAGWIKEFIESADLVSYEITRAERVILQEFAEGKETKIELTEAQAKKARSSFELTGPSKLFWDFEDEYWSDETGFYIYNIRSLCREMSTAR